jgi:hypothetical protein
MGKMEENTNNKRADGKKAQAEAAYYDDEINLIDYFAVLWKRKIFIFLGAVLPTMLVGIVLYLCPKSYTISYLYNMGLDEKSFRILEDTFYSTENVEKLAGNLQNKGLNKYALKLTNAATIEGLKNLISFEISPSYFEAIKPSAATNVDELQKIQQIRGSLLDMSVKGKSDENIRESASVCRENFEQIIPLYWEREGLNVKIISLKGKMADIEEERYLLDLQLDRKKSTLEKLKTSGAANTDKLPSDIILQFNNAGGDSAYLPLPYQIQAAETQIINLEEQVRTNKEMHLYYTDLFKINEKLLGHVKEAMPSHYTLEQFRSFLLATLNEYKDAKSIDYLNAYIKSIENKMANALPLIEKPKIVPAAKGTAKKAAIVFAACLMLSVFAAFLMEGIQQKDLCVPVN